MSVDVSNRKTILPFLQDKKTISKYDSITKDIKQNQVLSADEDCS